MIDEKTIRAGLRQLLLTVSGITSSIVSWENREFTPPQNSVWVRETLLPASEPQVSNDMVEAIGLAMYEVFWPLNGGTEGAESLAKLIKDAFKPKIAVNSSTIIVRAERDAGHVDEAWYIIPVRVEWRSYATI